MTLPITLEDELENFREIARVLRPSPGEVPVLPGIEMAGFSRPLRDVVGGDHLLYVDFGQRFDLDARIRRAVDQGRPEVARELAGNRRRAGVLLADVSGHRITDAAIAAMLHQAFLLGCSYELEMHGHITTGVFEKIKTRFSQSSAVHKYFTMLYGEIWSDGRFRFITAGHPVPWRLSAGGGRAVPVAASPRSRQTPVGLFRPAADIDRSRAPRGSLFPEEFVVEEIRPLEPGDCLILGTDGLWEHDDGRYACGRLGEVLRSAADQPLAQGMRRLEDDMLSAAPAEDDITVVVIRRAAGGGIPGKPQRSP